MIEYPTWQHVPDMTVIPTEGRTGRPDVTNLGSGPDFVSFPETRSERIFKLGFAWDIPREWHRAKAFFQQMAGRCRVFLCPTWNRDFTVGTQPTSGDFTLAVQVENYGETYLTTTARDEVGRYVFCYDFTGGLHIAKVLSSADDTESTLTLEQAFPFTPTREAVYGFAVIVRFATDESEWASSDPTHVKAELAFQTVLERNIYAATGPLEGIEQYRSLGFEGYEQEFVDTPLAFRVAYCNGPKNFHSPQNADLTDVWYCWPSTTGGFRLVKNPVSPPVWPDESQGFKSSLISSVVPTENVSVCFDQVGWEVIAWQQGANVKVLRRQNGVATTTTFVGISPALFWNGEVNVDARNDGDTDVVVYYGKTNTGAVFARFQRDNFAIERVVGGFPTPPLALIRHERDGLVHRLYAVDVGFRSMVLEVEYPAQPDPLPDPYVILDFAEAAGAGVEVLDTEDTYSILDPGPQFEAAAAAADVADIADENVAPPPTDFYEGEVVAPSVPDIAYELVVVSTVPPGDSAGGSAAVQEIAYDRIAVETSALQEQAGAEPAITDIYYGP